MKFSFASLISLDITKACNLHCIHCYNNSGMVSSQALGAEELRSVVKQIAKLRPQTLCLCGGEPLLSPYLEELLILARPHVFNLNIVSNGWLIDGEKANRLVELGVDMVQISLDGAFPWQHDSLRGAVGAFDRAVSAIKNLKAAEIEHLAVSMLPSRLTWHTLDEYFSLCETLGVDVIRIMPFVPQGRGAKEGRRLFLNEGETFVLQRSLQRLKRDYRGKLMVEWDDPVSTGRLLNGKLAAGIPPMVVSISAEGDIRSELYAPVKLGNLRERPLRDILLDFAVHDKDLTDAAQRVHSLYDLEVE